MLYRNPPSGPHYALAEAKVKQQKSLPSDDLAEGKCRHRVSETWDGLSGKEVAETG